MVHELNCDGALAYGGGTAFDGVVAYVAGDEDAGKTSFEEVRLAVELPGGRRI